MSRLSDFFTSQEQIKWLREENSSLRELLTQCQERLLTEIDSNRLRENELVNAALEAGGIRIRAGSRTPLLSNEPQMNSQIEQSDINDVVGIREDWVEQTAQDFIANNPEAYKSNPELIAVLKQAIRNDPATYRV